MNARTVIFLRLLGVALAILAFVLLWNWKDGVINGKELWGWAMIIIAVILVFAPKEAEPYAYTKKYPTYYR